MRSVAEHFPEFTAKEIVVIEISKTNALLVRDEYQEKSRVLKTAEGFTRACD